MIGTLAISGYRSIRDLVLSLDRLNVITGANGNGKSSLYRALRLVADSALNSAVSLLAREGGLPSRLWAGPEMINRAVRRAEYRVEPTASRKPVSLKLGFAGETYGYSIDFGYPPLPPPATAFSLHPAIKRECIWHGAVYRKAALLVERRNGLVSIPSGRGEEPVILTKA